MMRQQQRASTARRGGRDNSRVPMARSDWICSAADVLRCDHARARAARRRAIFRPTRSWATERVGHGVGGWCARVVRRALSRWEIG